MAQSIQNERCLKKLKKIQKGDPDDLKELSFSKD